MVRQSLIQGNSQVNCGWFAVMCCVLADRKWCLLLSMRVKTNNVVSMGTIHHWCIHTSVLSTSDCIIMHTVDGELSHTSDLLRRSFSRWQRAAEWLELELQQTGTAAVQSSTPRQSFSRHRGSGVHLQHLRQLSADSILVRKINRLVPSASPIMGHWGFLDYEQFRSLQSHADSDSRFYLVVPWTATVRRRRGPPMFPR